MRILLPVLGVFIVILAAAGLYLFKLGLDDYMASQSIASVPVAAPAGWAAQPYDTAQGEVITGAVLMPSAVGGSTTNDILLAFESAVAGDDDGVVHAFARGDERIVLRMRVAPLIKQRLSLKQRMGIEEVTEQEALGTVLGAVDGVSFVIMPQVSAVMGQPLPVPVDYRHITASIGDPKVAETIEVAVLTNSSDAAIAAVIGGLDIAALNEKLPTPSDAITPQAGFVAARQQPLSDVPPPPSAPYRAHRMLETASFDTLNADILGLIRAGDIVTMADLQVVYPKLDGILLEVLQLLDGGGPENFARYYAMVLSKSGRSWNNYEYYVLSEIAKAGTSQASLADYLSNGYDIAPEVMALVQRLPETSPEGPGQVPEAEAATTPVVTPNGQNRIGTGGCTLQAGVRRCVVGSD